jgi:hypothetical protein
MSTGTVNSITLKICWVVALSLGLIPRIWAQSSGCPPGGGVGQWSVKAVNLNASSDWSCNSEDRRDLRLYSPDHEAVIRVVKDHWWIESAGRKMAPSPKGSYVSYPAELAWSPDSGAFYITWSDGSIRGFQTEVYRFEGDRIESFPDFNQVVRRDFNRLHGCTFVQDGKTYHESPNIAALGWTSGSSALLVVAEAPPDSWCDRGYFGGYVVSLSDSAILRRYSPQQLNEQYGQMIGARLRGDFENLTKKEKSELP